MGGPYRRRMVRRGGGRVSTDGYCDFLAGKARRDFSHGFDPVDLNPALFDFQAHIVRWACRKGRAAVFADCGMGKTLIQLEWARQVCERTGGRVLVLAPLAVSRQTRWEAAKFGIDAEVARSQEEVRAPISITNYEMLGHFDPSQFSGVVLDESSILKSFTSKTRSQVTDAFAETPYRLACTATPAPNDHMELGNHAEFLGVMTRAEMLSMFFVHDGGNTSKWRLKGHAAGKFWDWVASWAVMARSPRDLGFECDGFDLTELIEHVHEIPSGIVQEGRIFNEAADGLLEQQRARRATVERRVAAAAQLVNSSVKPWIVWCDLNDESDALAKSIPDAVEVRGSDSLEHKEDALSGFSDGRYRVIVTKPSIAGFGMNWQHCADMVFVGLSNSYEQYYQAVRRCHRFGQTSDVNVHIIATELDAGVLDNIKRKEMDAMEMESGMIEASARSLSDVEATARDVAPYATGDASGDGWHAMLGDCVERMAEIPSESVGLSVFSPPFASLYTYSNSDRDMGNCKTDGEFMDHFAFMLSELYRVMMPGRCVSFHCMNLPTTKERDGYIGIRDFRGDLIRAFQDAGFIYHSEVTIWKDPVTAMQRTKALGLLNKQKNKDSSVSRQGIPDYLVTMRKPGDNPRPISHDNEQFPIAVWQKIASPVWMDINPSDTLQYRAAREDDDERHICPLQLGVIDRAIDLWSAPGDIVLSPFMGIGSEGWCALKKGRKFIGIELKGSYYDLAVKNLKAAEQEARSLTIFDFERVVA